jgi:hypothetical protein
MIQAVSALRRFLIALGVFAASLVYGALRPADALDVGPKSLPLTVAGVPVEIPVTGSLDVHTDAAVMAVKASATGDLQSIQDHALAIARGLRLPSNNCAHKGLNVVVDSIDEATIAPLHTSAVVSLSGHATVWVCSKILGAPVKARIASDHVSITAPVEIVLPTPQSIALRLSGPATIKTGDKLTTEAARAVVGDVNAALTAQLSKLLDSGRARAVMPPLPGLDATIQSAAFAQDGPRLLVRASGHATMTSAAFASFLGFISRPSPR